MNMNLSTNGASKGGIGSLIDDFIKKLQKSGESLSKAELDHAISSLRTLSDLSEIERLEERESAHKQKEAEAEARHVEEVTCMDLPMDWENPYENDERAAQHTDSVSDGLILSLTTLGRVDIEYISRVTGRSCREVIELLRGSIYQNPERWGESFLDGWETADEYLSGNLIKKWREAKRANVKYNGFFELNVKALDSLLPPSVATDDIYVTLGSPWVPTDIIDEFIKHLTKIDSLSKFGPASRTRHYEDLGLWEIPFKTRFRHTVAQRVCTMTYGTKRMEMPYILENTLNMKAVTISDEIPSPTDPKKTVRVINESETLLALEKQRRLKEEFEKWIWRDEKRKERLQTIYDGNYGAIRRRTFDGSFLTFPGMSDAYKLYDYQRNAVARMIFTPNTLLAHDVGSGKTLEMIAAGMEMRRMGISKKNMYVVPPNLTKQWSDVFEAMYPKARVLVVDPKRFTPDKRGATLRRMRDEDFDAIIIAYSCFDMIPLSEQFYDDQFRESDKILSEAKKVMYSDSTIDKKKKALRGALEKLKAKLAAEHTAVTFDSIGVNTLFVDEAHNYKNVPIDTKITGVLGISGGGSDKCRRMLEKAQSVQRANGGRGVILATGTPITNSITDVYVMQSFLQSGELALLGLQSFDSWVGMFAEKTSEFEIDVDTGNFRLATRFSRFHNLPELTSILSSVADFHRVGRDDGLPDFEGYTDSLITPTEEFREYLRNISERADDVRARRVKLKEDNMLKITTDGRKAALDLRLVSPDSRFTYQSKAARCAERVYDIYTRTASERSTQLIFCDSSTPKQGFNMYDEMRRLLVMLGIPDHEIAYIHDANTEKRRSTLFGSVRGGGVRVLIGSTFKLGLGVNVQDKLVAIHHLDVPWRPADMVQREGRIMRRGNTNREVEIHRYITEGSFDAYSWQLLETKQRFISQILSGTLTDRVGSDVDGSVLGYAEVKALAIGNPLIKRRVEVANRLSHQLILQREYVEERQRLRQELHELPTKISAQRELVAACERDIEFYKQNKKEHTKEELKEIQEAVERAIRANYDKPVETEALEYQGFNVIIPAFMSENRPHIFLERDGRYLVDVGTVRRIDFYLDELERQLEAYGRTLDRFENRRFAIESELAAENDYMPAIEKLKAELEKIDKELGVKKDA